MDGYVSCHGMLNSAIAGSSAAIEVPRGKDGATWLVWQ